MTLREFIESIKRLDDESTEDQKDKTLKYCGEWEAEIEKIEFNDFYHTDYILLSIY